MPSCTTQTTQTTFAFEIDGEFYTTDAETLAVLRSIVPDAKRTGDASAVAAVMEAGLMAGRIRPL